MQINHVPTISIGIPAYNEEANIRSLLNSLLTQEQDGFSLLEIIVISDGSSDRTVEEAKSVGSGLVRVIDHAERNGQAVRQNEILKEFLGDVLVLLNADILPTDHLFLKKIVLPISQNRAGLAAGKGITLPARTFFERIINFSVVLRKFVTERWNGGGNMYTCTGQARAFSRDFAKRFSWPRVVSEDAYSYLAAQELLVGYEFVPDAVFYFRSPDNFLDHVRQSVRFRQGVPELVRLFPNLDVAKLHMLPRPLVLSALLRAMVRHPLLLACYMLVYLATAIASLFTKQAKTDWSIAASSKKLT